MSILKSQIHTDFAKLFTHIIKNKYYYTYLVNNYKNKDHFINILNNLRNNNLSDVRLCFDYEYNYNKMSLCQVFITSNEINNIYLYSPIFFNNNENELIKHTLYLSNYKKILHGSDSLDIPYIYKYLDNKRDIIKFTLNMYDTRFMFENIKNINEKSSLYEGLLNSKTITSEQYDILIKLYNNYTKLYNKKWNIYSMSEYAYLYATYDVLFLNDFYNKLIKNADNLILNDITKLILLERNNITDIIKQNKNIINHKDINQIKNSNFIGIKIDYFRNYISSIYAICNKNKDIMKDIQELKLKNLYDYLVKDIILLL